MLTPEDIEFSRMAVVMRFIKPSELGNYLRLLEQEKAKEKSLSLCQWLIRNSYLDLSQVNKIQKACQSSSGECLTPVPDKITDSGECLTPAPDKITDFSRLSESFMSIVGNGRSSTKIQRLPDDPVPDEVLPSPKEQISNPEVDIFSPEPGEDKFKPGNIWGQYQILEELGRGGMGRVFKAYEPAANRIVALKVLLSGDTATQQEIKRFFREARTIARLQHPNIVALYDVENEAGQPYFSMEFVDGCSLKTLLHNTSLTISQIVNIMIDVCSAIHYAHENGIIHRDLKPANIMINEDNKPKVMDFGLVKVSEASTKLTKTGMVLGTLQYMSPEQACGDPSTVDARCDVYSLGATLYELLTGTPPVNGDTSIQMLYQILHGEPILPTRFSSKIPQQLENICLKALEKQRENRYPTAAALRDDLKQFAAGKPHKVQATEFLQRSRRVVRRYKKIGIAFLFLLLAICLALTWILYSRQNSRVKAEKWKKAGDNLIAQNKLEGAIDAYQKAIAINPDYADAYNALGNLYVDMGKLDEGILLLHKAHSIAPDLAIVQENLGNAYYWKKDFSQSISYYKMYLSHSSSQEGTREAKNRIHEMEKKLRKTQ